MIQAQCAGCHAMEQAGISGPVQRVGVDLDGIGSHRTSAWLLAELKDPCSHQGAPGWAPCSVMPSYAGFSPRQLHDIVAFLAASH